MQTVEEKRNRIIPYALRLFMNAGYQRVTMDEIARGVGMGKGTLYQLFRSKEELLSAAVDCFITETEERIARIFEQPGKTDVEKLGEFLHTVAERLAHINPEALAEIGRGSPETFEKIERARRRIIMTNLVRLLSDGQKSGLYRPETDPRLVAQIVIGAVRHITSPEVLETLSCTADELFRSLISVILKGCMTEKGREFAL